MYYKEIQLYNRTLTSSIMVFLLVLWPHLCDNILFYNRHDPTTCEHGYIIYRSLCEGHMGLRGPLVLGQTFGYLDFIFRDS